MATLGIFVLLFIIAYLFFWNRTIILWYVLVFLSPFTGLILNFSEFGFTKDLPYIGHVNAPYADFVALFLLAIVAAKSVVLISKGTFAHNREVRSTGWYFFWPFLLVAFLSIVQVDPDTRLSALKYFLRPIVFFYLVWIVLPQQVVTEKRELKNSMAIFLGVGLIAAVTGFLSLLINESAFGFFTRVTPFGWGNFYPFGWNQNLLAEVLVAAAPIAAYYMWRAEKLTTRKWHFLGFIAIVIAALLTFSRAAWVALIIEGLLYSIWYKKTSLRVFLRSIGIFLALLAPLIVYMVFFLQSSIVSSSNATRFDLTGIAWQAFTAHPFLGNGVGSFVPLVEETRVFGLEYGDPLDAHGIIQKLIAELGLFGLIAFSVFAGWCLVRLARAWKDRPLHSASRALLVCWFLSVAGSFVFQLFNTSYYGAHLWLPVGLALVAARLFEDSRV